MHPTLPKLRLSHNAIFLFVAIAGVTLRLLVSGVGYNFDVDSWELTAQLALAGKSVYASTYRYTYAPGGIYVFAALKWLALVFSGDSTEAFHFLVVAFLSFVDVVIGYFLFRQAGIGPACFYLFNPISILITGYHSQIDNWALALAYGSWLLMKGDSRPRKDVVSALLLGISLSIKHIFFFFPLWILLRKDDERSLKRRALYACIACSVPVVIMGCYDLLFPGSLQGFWSGVILYRGLGYYGTGLFAILGRLVAGQFPAVKTLPGAALVNPTTFWVVSMVLLGVLTARLRPSVDFYVYLAGITLFTPTIADQYLVIPLIACAVFWKAWPSWLYAAAGTAYLLLVSPCNIADDWGIWLSGVNWKVRCVCQLPLVFLLLVLLGLPSWRRLPGQLRGRFQLAR